MDTGQPSGLISECARPMVGVHENVIAASWQVLDDATGTALLREGVDG